MGFWYKDPQNHRSQHNWQIFVQQYQHQSCHQLQHHAWERSKKAVSHAHKITQIISCQKFKTTNIARHVTLTLCSFSPFMSSMILTICKDGGVYCNQNEGNSSVSKMIENCKKCKSEWLARTKTNDRVVGSRDGCHNCHNNKHCATPLTSIYCPSIVQHPLTTQIFSPDNWYARFVKCCSVAIWANICIASMKSQQFDTDLLCW